MRRPWQSFEADVIAARHLLGPRATDWAICKLVLTKVEMDDLIADTNAWPMPWGGALSRARLLFTDEIPF